MSHYNVAFDIENILKEDISLPEQLIKEYQELDEKVEQTLKRIKKRNITHKR